MRVREGGLLPPTGTASRRGERAHHQWGKAEAALFLLLLLPACSSDAPSTLDARGPIEREAISLWWPMLWVATAVTVFVVVMGLWGVAQGRRRRLEDIRRDVPWGDRFILIAGLGVTGVILLTFFVLSLRSMSALAGGRPASTEIEVIGHDWWWEARYANGAVTANEIHIPAGEPVRLRLRTADVIHSFWVPQLAPKMDMIPGRENTLTIEADEPGRYRGQCAEFCGLQHANMALYVVAEPPEEFRRWLAASARPAAEPTDALAARGREVFLSTTCIGCHAIRGTPARAELGPDLTHLAERTTIGAGVLPLTPESLRLFILDPGAAKPGVTMPPTSLSAEQMDALVAYLLGLGFEEPS